MGLFGKIKKVFSTTDNSTVGQIDNRKVNADICNYKYPHLFKKCSELYSSLTRYEFCLCGVEGVAFDKEMYNKTKEKMFLDSLEKNKYTIFIKPQIIKELIFCAKESYQLNKEEFLIALKEIFNIVAVNEEYTSIFCFEYLSKELNHYVY